MNAENPRNEVAASEETPPKWKVLCDVITITGTLGSGKSTLAKELALIFDIPCVSIGDTIRQHDIKRKGLEIVGKRTNTIKEDRAADRLVEMCISHALRNKTPIIIDARRGALSCKVVSRKAVEQKNASLKTFNIFLTTEYESVRYGRIFQRQHKKDPTLTFEQVVQKTTERQKHDAEKWQEAATAYPNLFYEINPYDSGVAEYDLVIKNDDLGIDEEINLVSKNMRSNNYLEKAA